MKPVYLEMKYFGPHEDSVIDFRELEAAPIFLIGGDTGAGKSTIFDAMTFALFGSTTGDRDAKDLRSQFAPDDQATEVTFYFEQGNNLYKMHRAPEQFLAKKNGSGLTKKATTAKLAIVNEVNGIETESVANKPVDVAQEITRILNLNADQFKKIILLPQNDFSEFLKSKTSDKETILKKIFGTQIYTKFTSELKDKYDDSRKQSEGFESSLQFEFDSRAWTDEEKEQLSSEATEAKVALLKQFVQKHQTELTELKKSKTDIEKTVTDAEKQYQSALDTQKKFFDLDKLKTDYQEQITEKTDIHQQQITHLAELQWANPLKDVLRYLASKTSEHQANVKTEAEQKAQLVDVQKKFNASQNTIDTLTKQAPDNEKKLAKITSLTALIPKVEAIEALQGKIKTGKPALVVLQDSFDKSSSQAKKLRAEIDEKNKNLVSLADLQTKRNELTTQREAFIEALSPLQTAVTNLTDDVSDINKELTNAKTDLKTKQDSLENAKTEYDQQISRRQDLMIAQLQKELVDGQPCVVCGATDHSNMVHTIDANEEELKLAMDQVDTAQNSFAAAEKTVVTAQETVSKNEQKLEQLNSQLDGASKTLTNEYSKLVKSSELNFEADFSMEKVKSVFDAQIAIVDDKLASANHLSDEIKELEAKFKIAETSVNDINLKLTAKKSELDSAEADLKAQSESISTDESSEQLSDEKSSLETVTKKFKEDFDSAKESFQQAKLDLSTIQTQLTDSGKRIEKLVQQVDQLQQKVRTALSDEDAKTSEQSTLQNWIDEINDEQLSKLQVSISSYNQEKKRLDAEITKLQSELTDVKIPEVDELKKKRDGLQADKDKIIEQVSVQGKDLKDAQDSFENVEKIIKEQGNFDKKLGEITSLYNIVNGKDGNDSKLKLETYVVQNYLQRVLNYANDHFINLLSNNRYSFELAAEGANKRTDHGLDINVFDNETGDSRSSNTLSGGETFIAALSIALSLSEVVQSSSNGVQIDALFVDEGFGSLDHETLDKAMTALETIGQNRMVGVISHIESMKNSIGQQVYIKKLGDGRSTVQMISK